MTAVRASGAAPVVVIASHNQGKIAEFMSLLAPLPWVLTSAAALGLAEPEETGITFAANAEIKARAIGTASGQWALADDSGLEVAALAGAPGVYSARYAGADRDFQRAMQRIETELAGQTDRRAQFVTVLALYQTAQQITFFQGTVTGTLIWPPRGSGGFGYDPMFVPDGATQTFAEMAAAEKGQRSHRGAACAALRHHFGVET